MSSRVAGCKAVKPLLSANYCEAHIRVVGLYKAYYRYIPYLGELETFVYKIYSMMFLLKYIQVVKLCAV